MAIPKEQGGQGVHDKKPSGAKRAAALRVAEKVVPVLGKIPRVSRFLKEHPGKESPRSKEATAISQKLSGNPLLDISDIFANAETITSSSNLDPDKKVSVVGVLIGARQVLSIHQEGLRSVVARKSAEEQDEKFIERQTEIPVIMSRGGRGDREVGDLIVIGLFEVTTDIFKLIAQQIEKAGSFIGAEELTKALDGADKNQIVSGFATSLKDIVVEMEKLDDDKMRFNLVLRKEAVKAVLRALLKKSEEGRKAKQESETTKQVAGKV